MTLGTDGSVEHAGIGLTAVGPMPIKAVEAERFLPGWRDRGAPVRATRLLLDGPAGAVVILVVRLEGDQHSWFAMGDRITTALLLDQLRGTLGEMLTESLPDEELADARAARRRSRCPGRRRGSRPP